MTFIELRALIGRYEEAARERNVPVGAQQVLLWMDARVLKPGADGYGLDSPLGPVRVKRTCPRGQVVGALVWVPIARLRAVEPLDPLGGIYLPGDPP